MTTRAYTPGRAIAFALLAGTLLGACETDRATVFEPVGVPSIDFVVGPGGLGLPSGSVGLGATSVTATMSGLRALTTGQYQFWVIGRDSQNLDVPTQAFGTVVEFFSRPDTLPDGSVVLDPVSGDTIFVTDSTVIADATAKVGGYAGSDDRTVTSVRVIIDSTLDLSNPATHHAVVISLEAAPATSPGPAQFLWRRIGVGGNGSMLFGNFGGSDVINTTSPNDYVFGARGAGLGGARGTEISVDLREVARPPVGFFYRGYVVDRFGIGVVVDTARSAWSPDSTVSRQSLYDADVNDLLPDVVGGEIRAVQVRNCAQGAAVTNCQNTMALPSDSTTFLGQLLFVLKLEPKGGVGDGPTKSITHGGALPDDVIK
jgi:hypothetical protein